MAKKTLTPQNGQADRPGVYGCPRCGRYFRVQSGETVRCGKHPTIMLAFVRDFTRDEKKQLREVKTAATVQQTFCEPPISSRFAGAVPDWADSKRYGGRERTE
jgi:hypothetical protein